MKNSNGELTRLSELIGLIYEGATDPSRWTKDILPAVADYIQAPECFLYTPAHVPQNGGYMFYHGITQDQVDLYFNKHQSEDIWVAAAIEKKMVYEGNVILGEELVPRERWLASKTYNECFYRDENMAQMLTSIVFGMDTTHSMPAVCSFFRGLHHADFCEKDRTRLQLVLPHLSRSLGVMQRLRSAELTVATSLAALDRLSSGVLLIDDSGAVAFANRQAQQILENDDGLLLCKLSHAAGFGNLVAQNAAADTAIHHAIRATLNRDPYATPHFSTCITVPHTSGLANYTLQFSALGNHIEFGGGYGSFSAIIFMSDGAQKVMIDPTLLQSGYGLTPTEAKVAIALFEASSAQEVAEILKISLNTANTHIKRIYAKLGVDTRARFVKLLLALASQFS